MVYFLLFVIWYANIKLVKNQSRDRSIYWSSYQNASIKRTYKLDEGLDKWSKPLIISLSLKVLKSEKIEGNIFTIKNLEDKVRRLEGEQKFLYEQDDLRCRKIDDLEQYGRRECLRFDGFEVSDTEISADCSKIVKDYIKNELKLELNDDDYYRIHRISTDYS